MPNDVNSSGDQSTSTVCEDSMLKAAVLYHNRAEKRKPVEGKERPPSLYVALRNSLVSFCLFPSSTKPPALL